MRQDKLLMEKIALNIRWVLQAAGLYAPNAAARAKARETSQLFSRVAGKPSLKDRATALVTSGALEAVRLSWHQARGHEILETGDKATKNSGHTAWQGTGWDPEQFDLPELDLTASELRHGPTRHF